MTAVADRALTDVVAIAVPLATTTTHDASLVTAINTDRLPLQMEHLCNVTIADNVLVDRWSPDSSAISVARQPSTWTNAIRPGACDAFASGVRKLASRVT